MFQLYAILIVGAAHAAELGFRFDPATDFNLRGWPAVAVAWGPMVAVFIWLAVVIKLSDRRMTQGHGLAYLDLADRSAMLARFIILSSYVAAVSVCGWGQTVQGWLGGDMILIDLLLTILPAVVGMMGVWALYYPIARRIRHAMLIRVIDQGKTIHAIPTRWRYVLAQLRMNLLFLLVPLLLIVTARDIIDTLVPIDTGGSINVWVNEVMSFVALVIVFTFTPIFARVSLDLKPLPVGEIRDRLLDVCRNHKVRIRNIMLWHTEGTMINGAVMGLLGRLRFVMLTDALLESMPLDQVEAVMAHEIGHVRRHHMPWLIGALLASVFVPVLVIQSVIMLLNVNALKWIDQQDSQWYSLSNVLTGCVVLSVIFVFGWISRRFERQADTFAVQHLSGLRGKGIRGAEAKEPVLETAADTMCNALDSVCRLNGMEPSRRSWRHGSISWRKAYLQGIKGKPLGFLPIDRQVRFIQMAIGFILICAAAMNIYDSYYLNNPPGKTNDNPPASIESPLAFEINVAEYFLLIVES